MYRDYDDELSVEYETNGERAVHNAIVTNSVRRLFAVLGAWGVDEDHELTLRLSFMSRARRLREKAGGRGAGASMRNATSTRSSFSTASKSSPTPPRVTMLAEPNGTRPVELHGLYALMSRLPKANCVLWNTVEAGPFAQLRRELRDRFVRAASPPPAVCLHTCTLASNPRPSPTGSACRTLRRPTRTTGSVAPSNSYPSGSQGFTFPA